MRRQRPSQPATLVTGLLGLLLRSVGNTAGTRGIAPPAEDIALVFLDAPVAGVTPAPIADADALAGLDLTSETFTVVGYGTDAYITGSAMANHPVVLFDGIPELP